MGHWLWERGTKNAQPRAAGAGLGVQNMVTHEFWAVAQSGIDPAMHAIYERLAPENRIWQAISRAGRPMADQMVMSKAEFLCSALHAEYLVPQGFHSVMAAPVLANGSHCGVVVAFGTPWPGYRCRSTAAKCFVFSATMAPANRRRRTAGGSACQKFSFTQSRGARAAAGRLRAT
jgi:hypothetical protein